NHLFACTSGRFPENMLGFVWSMEQVASAKAPACCFRRIGGQNLIRASAPLFARFLPRSAWAISTDPDGVGEKIVSTSYLPVNSRASVVRSKGNVHARMALIAAAALAGMALGAQRASATQQFWDVNGSTAGLGGAGT